MSNQQSGGSQPQHGNDKDKQSGQQQQQHQPDTQKSGQQGGGAPGKQGQQPQHGDAGRK